MTKCIPPHPASLKLGHLPLKGKALRAINDRPYIVCEGGNHALIRHSLCRDTFPQGKAGSYHFTFPPHFCKSHIFYFFFTYRGLHCRVLRRGTVAPPVRFGKGLAFHGRKTDVCMLLYSSIVAIQLQGRFWMFWLKYCTNFDRTFCMLT